MKTNRIESGLLRIFRYYTGLVSVAFLLLLVVPGPLRQEGEVGKRAMLLFSVTYGAVFLYLAFPKLEKILRGFYLPPALLATSLIPIGITNAKYQTLIRMGQPINNLDDTMNLVILLLFPLIITAWQYSFPIVFLYFVVIGFLDPLLLVLVNDTMSPGIYAAFNISLVRILALGAVGFMITELRGIQRLERGKLEEANRKLEEYARTSEQLAISRERIRLSRELHDTLAHTLSGLAIQLEAADAVIPEDQAAARQVIDRARETVRDGLGETRRALKALRASPLEDFGLLSALRRLAEAAGDREGLTVDIRLPDSAPDIPKEVEEGIYRIAQEALENVVRHSRAKRAEVELTFTKNEVQLTVDDDGQGFNAESDPEETRFGLRGMTERAAAVGGRFGVKSGTGKGTVVEFYWKGAAE